MIFYKKLCSKSSSKVTLSILFISSNDLFHFNQLSLVNIVKIISIVYTRIIQGPHLSSIKRKKNENKKEEKHILKLQILKFQFWHFPGTFKEEVLCRFYLNSSYQIKKTACYEDTCSLSWHFTRSLKSFMNIKTRS